MQKKHGITLDELVKGDKNLEKKLISEERFYKNRLSVWGCVLIAAGVLTGFWGGSMYPADFDLLGRITALLFYAVPLSAFLAHQLSLPLYLFAIAVLLPGITFISLASSGYRIFLCIASRNHKQFS